MDKALAKKNHVNLILSSGADKHTLQLIKDRDLEDIAAIIIQEKLSADQVQTLTSTWAEVAYANVGVEIDEPEAPLPNLPQFGVTAQDSFVESHLMQSTIIQPQAVTSLGSTIKSDLYNGIHYQITSNLNYNKVSGTFQLPTVYVGNASSSNPDVPYGFFGHYTDHQYIGFDAGVYYKSGTWRLFLGGYALRQVKNNSTGAIKWDWTNPGVSAARVWKELPVQYLPSEINKIYMVSKYEKFSNKETITVTYTNATTWAVIGSNIFDSSIRETKYLTSGVETGHTAIAVLIFSNSTMSNVYANREITIAWNNDTTRLPNTGTTVNNAKWSDVYLYNNSGYGLWDTNKTMRAEKRGRTQSFLNSITATITSMWYEDSVNINFN